MVLMFMSMHFLAFIIISSGQQIADPTDENALIAIGDDISPLINLSASNPLVNNSVRPSLAKGTINVQTLTMFEYDGNQIYVYAAKINDDTSQPKKWKFYYVPVLQPVRPTNSDWVWTVDKEVRMKLILGDANIEAAARRAIANKYSDDLVTNNLKFWDVAPLMIDSLVAYVVKGSNSAVQGVLPYHLIHPNSMSITLRFECTNHESALNITQKLLDGYYEAEVAFHFDGFFDVSTSMVTITGDQIKSVLSKTIADGGNANAQFIHRNQAIDFVGKYLTNVQKMIYVENAGTDLTALTAGLNEQFNALFQQGIQSTSETRKEMDVYGQVWHSSDLNPDRLTSEINKVFTLNETATQAHGHTQNYYNVNQAAASEYAKSGSASLKVGWKLIGGSASAQYGESGSSSQFSSEIRHDVMSESDIKHFIDQQSVEVTWEGEKFVPKAFKVVKVTDVADRMQVAVIARQLNAEQSKGAIIRTVSALSTPIASSLALFTGEIRLYASTSTDPPINWLRCNGSKLSRITYSRLFAVIGTSYDVNNNDSTTFQLPDLRGRVAMGRDPFSISTENTSRIGATGGQSRHILTNDQLPAHYHNEGSLTIGAGGSHTHSIYDPGHVHSADIREDGPGSESGYHFKASTGSHNWYSSRVRMHSNATGITINAVGSHAHTLSGNTGSTGNAHSFSLLNPYQILDYIIYAG